MMKITVINFSKNNNTLQNSKIGNTELISCPLSNGFSSEEYTKALQTETDFVMLVDADRVSGKMLTEVVSVYLMEAHNDNVGYLNGAEQKWFGKYIGLKFGATRRAICSSPFLIGRRESFIKIDPSLMTSDVMATAGYMLLRNHQPFVSLEVLGKKSTVNVDMKHLMMEYYIRYPICELLSGRFFKGLFSAQGGAKRQPVWHFLMVLFAVFAFVAMPLMSVDYGISGDENVDHTHAGYVLDYFANGDKKALDQPQTNLHYYGNSIQVVVAAICRWFDVDNYYEMRHIVSALVGAMGILFVGLLALRLGGGLAGLAAMLLMFFTPRYFGHSMNNLKDVPFAVGYAMSIFYTIRLFDHFPKFQWRYILGLILGIGLTLGTRSGGLILYPMLLMYAGLFYIKYCGWNDFYRVGKHIIVFGRIFWTLVIVAVGGYLLAILFWPYALQDPFRNVLISLDRFTNFSIGLRTMFDGEQMMSTMLPWRYAPKYLMIAMPIVIIVGFWLYMLILAVRRKNFSLNVFFIYFAAIMPVVWVIYKNSNLYGGIRHLLFVMPMMVVSAALCWTWMMQHARKYVKVAVVAIFAFLMALPVLHYLQNHPNEYVYFNEIEGGLKVAYGDFETDYYYNSLKESAEWLKKNVQFPTDRKTTIATNHVQNMQYYFRKDTNVRIIYTRYYEKYSKDWDYAVFANVYINRQQLKSGLFPPQKCLYTPKVDGYPMSVVLERVTHDDVEAFKWSSSIEKPREALAAFLALPKDYQYSEEALARMSRLYFLSDSLEKCIEYVYKALALHPTINEALTIGTICFQRMKKYDEALDMVNRILAENDSSPEAHYLRASVYANMYKYDQAISDLNTTLSYRPDHMQALNLGGRILYESGQYKQAAGILQKALKAHGDISVMVNMSLCLMKLDNERQSEELLNRVLSFKSDFEPAYRALIRLRLQQNRLPEAQQYLLNIKQQDAEYYVLKAMCLRVEKKLNEAMTLLNQSLQMEKSPEAVRLKRQWSK